MCNFCEAFNQSSIGIRPKTGEIIFYGNLIMPGTNSAPVYERFRYCPWCGGMLKTVTKSEAIDTLNELRQSDGIRGRNAQAIDYAVSVMESIIDAD